MTSQDQAHEFAEAVDGLAPLAVRAAATLRLADHIHAGHTDLHALAGRTGTDPHALHKLLRFLTSRGVFTDPGPDQFALTPLSATLLDEHPSGLRRWLDRGGIGARMDHALAHLDTALRTGRCPYTDVHGTGFYDDLAAATPDNTFDQLRDQHADSFAHELATSHPWPTTGHLVDVGGGTGAVLEALLTAHPGLSATLLDRPETVTAGMQRLSRAGLASRCTAAPGSFFDPLPPRADIYLLVNVLHNWNDHHATTILQNCAAAAHPESTILIIERIADTGDARALTAMDLRMFLLTGGQERTLQQFHHLATDAYLTLTHTATIPSGLAILTCHHPRSI